MKVRLVWIGKTRHPAIKALVEEYRARIARFAPVEIVQLRDRDDVGGDERKIIEKEGEDILARVGSDQFIVALDERGRALGSVEMADLIQKHRLAATRQITFVIGGYAGLSDAVRKRADLVLSLSRMTLTHEFARVLLAEQVYRAFTIIHDLPYQK